MAWCSGMQPEDSKQRLKICPLCTSQDMHTLGKSLRQTSYKHTSKEAADRRLPKPSGSMPASATWLAPYVVTEPSSQINHFSPIWRLLLLFCYGMS